MSRVMLVGLSKKENDRIISYFKTVNVECELQPTMDVAIERIPANPPTLIITQNPSNVDPLNGLRSVLRTSAPTTPFLVVLNQSKAASALEVMNAGAYDCLAQPLDRFRVLAASKRAAFAHGRTLFGQRLKEDKIPWLGIVSSVIAIFILFKGFSVRWNGGPANTLNLASATLSGVQWEDRSLWVGNWYDSTVTHYVLRKGLAAKSRSLSSEEIFKMQDSQPILVCNTPDSLITVGFDLKIRAHQRAVGLPTLQTVSAPATNPTGLAWDGENVWSVDGQSNLLYKHGADLRVIDSMKSLVPNPSGLTWDGSGFWIIGGAPLRTAKLEKQGATYVWKGPYPLANLMPPDVTPTGLAFGFNRVWVISGGTPHMISRSVKEMTSQLEGWK